MQSSKLSPRLVVGIGASAGGLTAIKDLLPTLPKGLGVAYIALLHMDPAHPTQLDQILGKLSALNVQTIKDGTVLQSDALYIVPSDKVCIIREGKLFLETFVHTTGPRHSIDNLFCSIAEDYPNQCAGIILSGTGSDGLQGCKAIKANNGIVLVQEPSDAQYTGMPDSVIQARLADLKLPVKKIGDELSRIIEWSDKNKLQAIEPHTENSLEILLKILMKKTGFAFDQYKESTIRRRIERRMVVNEIDTLEDYITFVQSSDTEADAILKDIQISVTEFFRDENKFECVTQAIKSIIENKKYGDVIRIWVPGCATGEEVYSIAMLVADQISNHQLNLDVKIFGTDIDEDAITVARKAMYLKNSAGNIPADFVRNYIDIINGTFQIKKNIRDMMVFAIHDLLQDPPFSKMDMISCRNVLIYFKRSAQEHIITNFHYGLKPNGYLVLGASESIGKLANAFQVSDKYSNLYLFKDVTGVQPTFNYNTHVKSIESYQTQKSHQEPIYKQLRDVIFDEFAPPCVVVDQRMNVIHVHGDVSKFIKLPQGDINVNVINMVITPLRLEVHLVLQKAQREGRRIEGKKVSVSDQNGNYLVYVTAIPILLASQATNQTLLTFEVELIDSDYVGESTQSVDENHFRTHELEQELNATRDILHSNIEELEATNEEFQSTTEELQSANEEFQTTNEELKSSNEELSTVNEELRLKSESLELANKDLEGILGEIASGIVILDNELRVTRYSTTSQKIFDLLPTSIGKPLISVGMTSEVDLGLLSNDIHKTIKLKQAVERELVLDDKNFLVRIIPQLTNDKELQGLIISFTDETDRIRSEREARRLATIVKDSNDAITLQSLDRKIMAWNKGAINLYGYSKDDAIGMEVTKLIPEEKSQEYEDLIKRASTGEILPPIETKRLTKSGQVLSILLTITALINEARKCYAIATTERDITSNKMLEMKKRQVELEHLGRFNSVAMMAATLAHDLNQPLTAIGGFCDAAFSVVKQDSINKKELIQILKDTDEQVHRASAIVQNIREYVARQEMSKNDFDLNEIVKDSINLVKFECVDRDVTIKLTLAKGPLLVNADKIQIQHALINLLKNAIDSITKTTQTERIIMVSSQLEGDKIQLCVEDTGVGIPPHLLNLLSKPFDSSKPDGLGIGLLICRFIIEEHGGHIWFDPNLMKGAKVCFSLPTIDS